MNRPESSEHNQTPERFAASAETIYSAYEHFHTEAHELLNARSLESRLESAVRLQSELRQKGFPELIIDSRHHSGESLEKGSEKQTGHHDSPINEVQRGQRINPERIATGNSSEQALSPGHPYSGAPEVQQQHPEHYSSERHGEYHQHPEHHGSERHGEYHQHPEHHGSEQHGEYHQHPEHHGSERHGEYHQHPEHHSSERHGEYHQHPEHHGSERHGEHHQHPEQHGSEQHGEHHLHHGARDHHGHNAEDRLGKHFRGQEVPEQYQDRLIAEALRLAGHRATPSEIKYARALVNQESGFNAGAVNHWDSNARAGTPSKGWAQVIDSTFQQYHARGHGDIWNPVDNLAAGIRYADSVYGNLDPAHDGLRWVAVHRSMRHLGY
jgi:hypothetical protein